MLILFLHLHSEMKFTATKIKRLIKRKIATAVLVAASVAAFATLGDGDKKSTSLKSERFNTKTLSLRPAFNFRSHNLFCNSTASRYIMMNTVVTYQKGNATYILPLKKKVLLDKIKFSPAPHNF